MKKTLFVFLMLCLFSIRASAQQVTFSVNNVTVKTAMQRFYKATGYAFVYYSQDVDVRKRVTVNAEE